MSADRRTLSHRTAIGMGPGGRWFTRSKWRGCYYFLPVEIPEAERRLEEPLLAELLGALEGWRREGQTITKTYVLRGFTSAMAFADRVALAATAADHHPDIHIERYRQVRIVLTTHATSGISRADIDLARVIDGLAPPATKS